MGRNRSRSYSPRRSKRYDEPRRERERRRSSPPPSGLLVRNIPLDARPEELRFKFEKFGPIRDVYLPKHYYTGEPRGFGFVKFRHPEDAAEAKDHLNNTVIGGREIRIVFAEENRKAPNEMRRVSHVSDRGSYWRRSPVRSSRRHYRSPSRSPSPAISDQRDRRARDDRYSPHSSRSVSRSISPRDEREDQSDRKSRRRSRSISRSHDQKNYSHRSPTPSGDGRAQYEEPSKSPSSRGEVPLRSLRSPRPKVKKSRDERSSSPKEKVLNSLRSQSPKRNGKISRDKKYGKPDKSPSSRDKACSPTRLRSISYRESKLDYNGAITGNPNWITMGKNIDCQSYSRPPLVCGLLVFYEIIICIRPSSHHDFLGGHSSPMRTKEREGERERERGKSNSMSQLSTRKYFGVLITSFGFGESVLNINHPFSISEKYNKKKNIALF